MWLLVPRLAAIVGVDEEHLRDTGPRFPNNPVTDCSEL